MGSDRGDGRQAAEVHGWGPQVAGDEFDGADIDDSLWRVYVEPGHAGNGRRLREQAGVTDGHLRITGTADGDSAGMAWREGQVYGRWEVRMRVDQQDVGGNRYHPVLILWPDSDRWPDDGELDYAESDSGTTAMEAFLHYGDGTKNGGQNEWVFDAPIDLTQWHNYAIEWTADHVAGYIDGELWFDDTDPRVQPPGPMHQTIQLDNFFPECNLNPSTMDVDWVRMYDV